MNTYNNQEELETIELFLSDDDKLRFATAYVKSTMSYASDFVFNETLNETQNVREALLNATLNEFVLTALVNQISEHGLTQPSSLPDHFIDEKNLPIESKSVLHNAKLNQLIQQIFTELESAVEKFPEWPTDPHHALSVLNEEVGEMTKDVLQLTYEPHKTSIDKLRKEALQAAAMILRFLYSLEDYKFKPSKQHKQKIIK